MEKRDLTEYISQQTVLRLTEEAFSPKAEKQKVHSFPRWAALAACLALVMMALNFDTVYAAVRELLYFLPGKGPVAEQTFPDYWLPTQEYAAHTEDTDYLVTYLYRWDDTLSLRVKKVIQGPDLMPDADAYAEAREAAERDPSAPPAESVLPGFSQIAIRDEKGNLLEFEDDHHSAFAVYSPDEAQFEEEWEFSGFTLERFTLLLDDAVEFPVQLRKIEVADYAVTGGTTVLDQGYIITLLPLNQNCTRFALLTALGDAANAPEGSYWNSLSYETEVVGESGTVYQAESVNSRPGCQEFYLPDLPEEKIERITVTGILESTRYEGRKRPVLTLPALELGEFVYPDQELALWNDTIVIEATGLTKEGELWVRFRCREWDRRLNQLDLEWPKGSEKSQHTVQRTAVEESGMYTVYTPGMETRAGKKTTLPVSFVSVVQEGRWEFQVP